jgi:hypothetical protein
MRGLSFNNGRVAAGVPAAEGTGGGAAGAIGIAGGGGGAGAGEAEIAGGAPSGGLSERSFSFKCGSCRGEGSSLMRRQL